ncbi:hypothetical protein JTB14_010004 [Gonioctena quinquepunctata]|nr:hypothetical protein JTB14_010004 [Gonioctena quinquepunctata]
MESELIAMIKEQEIRYLNKKVQTLESLIAKSSDDKNNVSDVCIQTSFSINGIGTEAIIQEGTQTDVITFSTGWTQTESETENEINTKKNNKRKYTLKRGESIGKLRKKKKSGKNDLDNGFKVLMMDKNDNLNIQTKKDITPLVTTNDVLNLKCNGNPKENNEGEVNFEEDGARKATDDEKNGAMDASISEPVYAAIEEVSTKKIIIIGD